MGVDPVDRRLAAAGRGADVAPAGVVRGQRLGHRLHAEGLAWQAAEVARQHGVHALGDPRGTGQQLLGVARIVPRVPAQRFDEAGRRAGVAALTLQVPHLGAYAFDFCEPDLVHLARRQRLCRETTQPGGIEGFAVGQLARRKACPPQRQVVAPQVFQQAAVGRDHLGFDQPCGTRRQIGPARPLRGQCTMEVGVLAARGRGHGPQAGLAPGEHHRRGHDAALDRLLQQLDVVVEVGRDGGQARQVPLDVVGAVQRLLAPQLGQVGVERLVGVDGHQLAAQRRLVVLQLQLVQQHRMVDAISAAQGRDVQRPQRGQRRLLVLQPVGSAGAVHALEPVVEAPVAGTAGQPRELAQPPGPFIVGKAAEPRADCCGRVAGRLARGRCLRLARGRHLLRPVHHQTGRCPGAKGPPE
jgi:hypothetical protein